MPFAVRQLPLADPLTTNDDGRRRRVVRPPPAIVPFHIDGFLAVGGSLPFSLR